MPIFDEKYADLVVALVDDDADDRFIIRRTLNLMPQKLAIIEYENAKQCLEDFVKPAQKEARPAELIILDLNMPIMSGQDFLKEFRAIEKFDTVPIVVLTTADDEETLRGVLDLGANASLSKTSDWQGRGALSQLILDYWMTAGTRILEM